MAETSTKTSVDAHVVDDDASRVGVVGSCMLDFSVFVEKLPRAGQTVHASGPLHRGLGGKGANQAVQARLLESDVVFVGRVGDDPLGLDYLEGLKKWGLDTSFVTPTPQVMTGYASIWVGKADRSNSIVIAAGANDHLSPADVDKAFDMLAQCRVVMFQMETPMETTIHAMRRLKTEVKTPPVLILNTAPAPVDGVLPEEVYKYCDVICPNETEVPSIRQ
jgi:ribokinase